MADTPWSHMVNHRIPAHTARAMASSVVLTALAACSTAPLPRPPEPLPPRVAAEGAAPRRPSLLGDEEPPDGGLSVGPVSTFTARFEPVPLPPRVPTIVSVNGRDERDVWMLAENGHVLRWDGTRITDRGAPHCFVESCCGTLVDCAQKPAMCGKSAAAMEVTWSWLRLTPDDVIAHAWVDTGGMRASIVESRLGQNGRWSCEQGKEDLVYPGAAGRGDGLHALELSLDGASLHFEGPAVLVNRYGGHLLLVDGRRVPLPAGLPYEGARFVARAPDDLWLWGEDGRVWRGNGLTWAPQRADLASVADIWFAAPASAWLLGAMGEGEEQLLRWDLDKGGGQVFETPGAASMLGDGRDFWLVGKTALYHWDGVALRRTEPPLAVEDSGRAWRGPSGEIWLVGADPTAGSRAGAVVRLPGGQKP